MTKKSSVPSWLKKALTAEQLKPLLNPTRVTAMLASAGSGKTHALVHAVAKAIIDGANPGRIVAFTFTEKAAEELLVRIHSLVSKRAASVDISDLKISTIHSWCFDFLQGESEFYNVDPLDELQVDSLVARCYDVLQLESVYDKRFPRGIGLFVKDLEIFYNESLPLRKVPQSPPEPDAYVRCDDPRDDWPLEWQVSRRTPGAGLSLRRRVPRR